MRDFKYHLVTVIGIFLALSVGIFIGSATSDDIVIRQQRHVIMDLESQNLTLAEERRYLTGELEQFNQSLLAVSQLAGNLTEWYLEANPIGAEVMLILKDDDFSADDLGHYFWDHAVSIQVHVAGELSTLIDQLGLAISEGNPEYVEALADSVLVSGTWRRPDWVVLLMPPSEGPSPDPIRKLGQALLDDNIPVIAVGKTAWGDLSGLFEHPLYASVSHVDTPVGMYCLAAILHGQEGHYGPGQTLLPWGDDN